MRFARSVYTFMDWPHSIPLNSFKVLTMASSSILVTLYLHCVVRLREFRGLAPQSVFGGQAPQIQVTMVIILPPLPSPLTPLINIKIIG
jgi:hypothetical protein